MPVIVPHRQPDTLAWFASPGGLPLLAAEAAVIHKLLPALSSQAWLWLAPIQAGSGQQMPANPRGLALYRQPPGFAGAVRCGLPLPLPTESIRHIVLQHAQEDGNSELLEECARVLEPGGRLWLFCLNPWSPYRLRWRGSGLQVNHAAYWASRMHAHGLRVVGGGSRQLGPLWRMAVPGRPHGLDRLRAVSLLELEKRAIALIPPAPLRSSWRIDPAPVRTSVVLKESPPA